MGCERTQEICKGIGLPSCMSQQFFVSCVVAVRVSGRAVGSGFVMATDELPGTGKRNALVKKNMYHTPHAAQLRFTHVFCLASGRLPECPIKHLPLNLHLNWKPTGQSVSNCKCKLECSSKVAKHGQEADVGPLPLSLSVSLSLSLSPGLQPRADYNT